MRSAGRRPLAALVLTTTAVLSVSVGGAAAAPGHRAPVPVYGRSIVVIPVSGRVLIGGARRPLHRPRTVRSGSLVDVPKGSDAVIEAASPHSATTHTANLSGGAVRVVQPPAGKGTTDLVLAGRVPACDAAQAARVLGPVRVSVPAHGRRRHATIARSSGVGQFRLVGMDGSAVNNGSASYQGTQACHAMTVADNTGTVSPTVRGGASAGIALQPGKTWTSRCSAGAGTAATGPYCVTILGSDSHGFVAYVTGLFAKTAASTYDLCQTIPGQPQVCQTWALTTPDDQGYREGLVACMPPQPGTYSVTWQIGGVTLGAPLTYNSAIAATEVFPCNGTAGTPYRTGRYLQGLPSRLKIVNSYTLPTAAWLAYLSVDLVGQHRGKESLSAVVYQDDGGHPGRLIASTQPCVVSGRNTSDCDRHGFVFSPNINVPAGTYWFGLLTSGQSDIAQVQAGRTALAYVNDNPLSAATDPFGAAATLERRMSLQVNYTINPPPGASAPTGSPSG